MALAPGTTLSFYRILGPLGAGGMGEVYRAHDTRLDRDVAIKILPDAFVEDRERVARLEQKARAIAALSHLNVLAVFNTGVADEGGATPGRLYVVTELLEGETLGERLASG